MNDGIENIYSISIVINRIIKARKFAQGKKGKPTKIVIDSLRNSLEIMFFKERYSAFYMLATKDVLDNSKSRIIERLQYSKLSGENKIKVADKLLELDETEYKTNDFSKGNFSSPDVENCIQKSDFHILNLKEQQIPEFLKRYDPPFGKLNFITREEQLMKLIALISQPGIVTPSALERAMQIANTAKLNSGCISRNVGAAITDSKFHIKSIGWNDVAKGHTPCNLRNIEDLIEEEIKNENHYSDFEKGLNNKSIYKYKNKSPGNFKEALKDYFSESYKKNKIDLNVKNCSFCFKTIHNHYEGEANQVHTRSLHAEENAMLQITKLGGVGVQGGILFTTASPCELCSKKAFQLGIKTIYFIDPYPGISNEQILKGGDKSSRPIMIPFSGAIGSVYQKLYDSFLSYKDEISMTLELKSKNKVGIQFLGILESLKGQNKEIRDLLELKDKFSDQDVIDMIIRNVKSN
jgi:deoxycytidylate deaminase